MKGPTKREAIKRRIVLLENAYANLRSECPMDYGDLIRELRELRNALKGTKR